MARNSVLVLRILSRLGDGKPQGLSELASALGSPKTSVFRAVSDLMEEGWVRANDFTPPRYLLTGKIVAAARGVEGLSEVSMAGSKVLDELHAKTLENVQLSVLEDKYVVPFDRRESAHTLRVHLPLGERMLWHATAAGRAIAGHLPAHRLEALLQAELPALTDRTITDPVELRKSIEAGRAAGYVINDSGWRSDVISVGAAILDSRGFPVAGLSVNGVASRMGPEAVQTTAHLVRDAAATITRLISH